MTPLQLVRVNKMMAEWTTSMINRTSIVVEGKFKGEYTAFWGIVNRIEAESGSGLTYNLTTSDGHTVFVNLA